MHYLVQILFPLGFLSLLAPLFAAFAVPELFISLLSNNPNLYQIYYQYTATITPFVFISAIYGTSRLLKWIPAINKRILIVFLLFVCFYTAYLYGPLPGAVEANTDMFTKTVGNSSEIDRFLDSIPRRYSVSASNNLGSHLSQRQNYYTIPLGIDKADVVAFLLNDPNALPPISVQKSLINKLRKDPYYLIWYEKGDFIVFLKKSLPAFSPSGKVRNDILLMLKS